MQGIKKMLQASGPSDKQDVGEETLTCMYVM